MIVATLGHVDHGKTSLVRALTGVDTDTLAEEVRRGMTIDAGFAHADLNGTGTGTGCDSRPGIELVGLHHAPATVFVDLPGHERFMRNLLAGIAAVDVALLVVAADDGPMPQTREHLAILSLLGVPRLAVVLTKGDRVSPQRLMAAEQEIVALLAPGPFAKAPVFKVVAGAGIGLPDLKRHLVDVDRSLPARAAGGHFRLAVDRSFSVTGAGRVVTGAVLSGRVEVGDRLIVSPGGASVRVRGLQSQNRPVESAAAGERVAVNLVGGSGLRAAETARGDWLVAPSAHAPTVRLDVQLDVPTDAARPLAGRGALLLHLGAAVVPVRLVVLFGSMIPAGGSGMAQLLLDGPVAAAQADRFLLRDPAAHPGVIAGGRVLDPFAPARDRQRPHRAAFLAAMGLPGPVEALHLLLSDGSRGVDLDRFACARNLTPPEAAALLKRLAVEVVDGGGGGVRWGMAPGHARDLRERVRGALADWHAEQPESVGPSETALAQRLGSMVRNGDGHGGGGAGADVDTNRAPPGAPIPLLLRAALTVLVAEGAVVRDGLRWRLAGHRAVLSSADALLLARVAASLEPSGLRPPIVGELATALGLPLPELLAALARIARHGALVPVAPNRYFLPVTVTELADQARRLSAESGAGGRFDAAAFRDRTGIGRNLTVQVLEFLDREGVTRFDGTSRSAVDGGVGCFRMGTRLGR